MKNLIFTNIIINRLPASLSAIVHELAINREELSKDS